MFLAATAEQSDNLRNKSWFKNMEQEFVTLSGVVETVVYRNENNGWTVFEMDCGDELFTVVGTVFQIQSGEELKVMGQWVNHPNYGRQFKAESFERSLPTTSAAILKYLSSGAVKGIGPATALKIIERFAANALDVIENEPEKLAGIKGISIKKAQDISADYRQQFGVRSLMLFLQQYNVTAAESIRIWKRWGVNALDMLKKNPYVLCGAGLWISFERADAIAAEMGYEKDDMFRVRAGISHILRHNLFNGGHTYIPLEKLVVAGSQLLQVSGELTERALEELTCEKELIQETIREREAIFLPDAYRAETYAAGRLSLMLSLTPPSLGDCSLRIVQAEEQFKIKYAHKQKQAITTAYQKGIMILTGGPGTGKTTTLNAIIHIYEGMGLKVALAAPTGRAAKRMSEVTGREAKTIHRLLEMEYTTDDLPRFARNEKNTLDFDALIVDELSMVDIMLFESLLRAMKLTCRLVMVGDSDQLPPVGSGNALRDMIDSKLVPTVELDEIFRQASKSLIVINAHKIVRGEMPDLESHDRDFFFMRRYTAAQVGLTVSELLRDRLPSAYGFSPLWDIQVLVPGRKGELGANELNNMLQKALNPPSADKAERQAGAFIMREGDKIMQIKNNYDITWVRDNGEKGAGIFNGDVGMLEALDERTGALRVRYDDRVSEYGPEDTDELELAYAVTVHKSQGSEFKAVVIPLFSGAPQLLYRNLLYTAVTRAREIVIIVGRDDTVARMVQNDKKTKRYTGLCEFLRNGGGVG
jgi:exodeoxyribonuclease V alpha subunit